MHARHLPIDRDALGEMHQLHTVARMPVGVDCGRLQQPPEHKRHCERLGGVPRQQRTVPRRHYYRLNLGRVLDGPPAGQTMLHALLDIAAEPEDRCEQFDRPSLGVRPQKADRGEESRRPGPLL